jgi:hypothetical protein
MVSLPGRCHLQFKFIPKPFVVVIEKGDPFALRRRYPGIARSCTA